MTLLSTIQSLPYKLQCDIYELYQRTGINHRVREYLAEWIEQKMLVGAGASPLEWNVCQRPDPETINRFIEEFIQEIWNVARKSHCQNQRQSYGNLSPSPFHHIFELEEAAKGFRELNALDLYERLETCIQMEIQTLRLAQPQMFQVSNEPEPMGGVEEAPQDNLKALIQAKIDEIVARRTRCREIIDAVKGMLAEATVAQQKKLKLIACLQSPPANVPPSDLQHAIASCEQFLVPHRQNLRAAMDLAGENVAALVALIPSLVETGGFIHRLKWSEIRTPVAPSEENSAYFEEVQKWYTDIIETFKELQVFWDSVDFPSILEVSGQQQFREQANNLMTQLRSSLLLLLQNSLAVQVQPPQTLKKDSSTKDVKVRFLIKHKFFDLGRSTQVPKLYVYVLDDPQSTKLAQNGTPDFAAYGVNKIMPNFTNKEIDNPVVEFKALNHLFVKRPKDTKDAKVLRDKNCILFYSEFNILGERVQTWCVSNPFVYMSNDSQKVEGLATIFWYDYFRKDEWLAFQTKEEMEWSSVKVAISDYFKRETKTQYNLTPANLEYIRGKLFADEEPGTTRVTLHLMNIKKLKVKDVDKEEKKKEEEKDKKKKEEEKDKKKKGGEEKHSFWEWLYALVSLIRDYFPSIWKDGYIIGFIDRVEAEEKRLKNWGQDTFLLRFSDSILGGVSVIYLSADNQVQAIKPFTKSDLAKRSLALRIQDVHQFQKVLYFDRSNAMRVESKAIAFPPAIKPPADEAAADESHRPYAFADLVMKIQNLDLGPTQVLFPIEIGDDLPDLGPDLYFMDCDNS